MRPTLPIICANGIGDSMLVLGRVPVRILGRLGFRFRIYYASPAHGARQTIIPLLRAIQFSDWIDGDPTNRERWIWAKMMALSQRIARVWPVPLKEQYSPRPQLNESGRALPSILIQTHMERNNGAAELGAKRWLIERWVELIHVLRHLGWTVSVLEWDESAVNTILDKCPGTKILRGNLPELVHAIAGHDRVVSVDSWVKYVAAWYRKTQVIIVPDLRTRYTPCFATISAKEVADWWFHGLIRNRDVTIIGLDTQGDTPQYSLRSLEDLTVAQILAAIGVSKPEKDKDQANW